MGLEIAGVNVTLKKYLRLAFRRCKKVGSTITQKLRFRNRGISLVEESSRDVKRPIRFWHFLQKLKTFQGLEFVKSFRQRPLTVHSVVKAFNTSPPHFWCFWQRKVFFLHYTNNWKVNCKNEIFLNLVKKDDLIFRIMKNSESKWDTQGQSDQMME